MKQYIDKAAVVAEIERKKEFWESKRALAPAPYAEKECKEILSFIDTLEVKETEEESESEDLEEAVENYAATGEVLPNGKIMINFQAEKAFRAGAKWQEEHLIDKACEWLSNISLEDMEYKYDGFDTSESWYKFIEDFRKYMSL